MLIIAMFIQMHIILL